MLLLSVYFANATVRVVRGTISEGKPSPSHRSPVRTRDCVGDRKACLRDDCNETESGHYVLKTTTTTQATQATKATKATKASLGGAIARRCGGN